MTNVPELFGSMVFNQKVMKERLSKETYNALKKTLDDGVPLNLDLANQVAHVMKENSFTAREDATSPALCPPIPSATTRRYSPV